MKVSKEDNNYIYYWVGKNIKKQRKIKVGRKNNLPKSVV